ncbi:MAG: hypothetical protein M9899_01565 [Bdellovibrionaceae bacterium]|nr:hypothetical protein [Pseudobdellovibrionaceae bacterium]
MLIVTLSLIVGLSIHFIKPLGDYLKHNVGEYIQCLLETGQLPFILVNNPSSECDLEGLQASSLAESSGTSGGSGSSGDTGSSSSSDSDSDSRRGANNKSGNSGNNSNNSGSGNSGNNGLSQNRSGALTESGGGSGSGGGGGSSGSNRGQKLAAKINVDGNGDGIQRGQNAFYKYDQDLGRGISGTIPVERKPEEEKLASVRNPTEPPKAKRDNQVEGLRKSGFTAQMPAPQKMGGITNENVDLGLDFGKYIRYLIIGGIIFALVLMVVLQLNSLRKSMSGGD